jgi:UDP-glucose 4-epimerase
MKAIVTGSEGFIGKSLVEKLENLGYEVIGYDIKNGDDVTLLQNIPEVDEIYHLAATNGTKLFYEQPSEVLKNNTLITFAFDKYMHSYPNTRFIFASTCEIFNGAIDEFNWEVPTSENVPAVFNKLDNPRWSYSLPKALAENYYINKYTNVSIIRYFNIFGEHQVDHFISEFIERAIRKKEYKIYGNDTRAFCYVKDAVAMTAQIGKSGQGTYNVGRQKEENIEIIARQILNELGLNEGLLEIFPGKIGSAKRRCPSMEKYETEFGGHEYTDFSLGLKETIKWNLKEMGNL